MTPAQFPHCERVGLRVIGENYGPNITPLLIARDVEAYLAKIEWRMKYLDDCQCSSIVGTDPGGHRCSTCGKFIKQPGDSPAQTPAFFTADDFETQPLQWLRGGAKVLACTAAAEIANRILAERGVRVYGARERVAEGRPSRMAWDEHASPGHDTHTALLIGITEIKKGCPTCGK